MQQVRNIVSDDAAEFEEMINKELRIIGDNLVRIRPYVTSAWAFSALIIFEVEE